MGYGFTKRALATGWIWLCLALFAAGFAKASASQGRCAPDILRLRGPWGEAQFTVEIANTGAARAKGLMNRETLPRMAGMLFVYERPQPVAFWMKNTLIPLDMLFADETGRIQRIHENAVPGDLSPIPGGQGIQYVLEINGGMAARFGISIGSEMQSALIPASHAVWPCSGE